MKKNFLIILFSVFLLNSAIAQNEFLMPEFAISNVSANGKYLVGCCGPGGGFLYDTETGQYESQELMQGASAVTNNKVVAGNFTYKDFPFENGVTKTLTVAGVWEHGDWTSLGIGNLTVNEIGNESDGSVASSISEDGTKVGGYLVSTYSSYVKPCVWTKKEDGTWNCQMYTIPSANPQGAKILSISGDGRVASGWVVDENGERQPVIWTSPTEYVVANSDSGGEATSVSKNGKYVVFAHSKLTQIYHVEENRFESIPTHIGAVNTYPTSVNDEGMVVGYSVFPGYRFGFFYSPLMGFFDLADFVETFAPDVNTSPIDFRLDNFTVPVCLSNDGKVMAGWWGSSVFDMTYWILKLAEKPETLNRPLNFEVEVTDHQTVSLSWDKPEDMSGAALTGYKIYRNNVLFESTNPDKRNYSYDEFEEGTHYYAVSAVYDAGESPKTDKIFVEIYNMELPFFENFDSETFSTNFWKRDPDVGANLWLLFTNTPFTYTRGLVKCGATFVSPPEPNSYSLVSKDMRAKYDENVYLKFALSFYINNLYSSQENMYVEVFHDSEWETVATYNASNLTGSNKYYAWNIQTIDLSGLVSGKDFKIRFRVNTFQNESNTWDIDNIRVDITPFFAEMPVPAKPEGVRNGNNAVDLKWKTSGGSYDLTFFSGVPFYAIGNEGLPFIAVNSYTAEKLAPWFNKYLTSITVHISEYDTEGGNHKLSLAVFYGDDRMDYPINSYIPNAWNTFYLKTPLLLNEAKDLKFGVNVIEHNYGEIVISTDFAQSIDFDGNMYSEDDGVTWQKLYDSDNKNNWAIIGNITESIENISEVRDEQFLGYIVRRNGEQTGNKLLYQTNFRDTGVNINSKPEYTVSAYYSNGTESDLSDIFVFDPGVPVITTGLLPNGKTNEEYIATLTATGSATITWTYETGNLPDGLTLSPEGVISGMTTVEGIYIFTVKASNAAGSNTKNMSITITKGEVGICNSAKVSALNASIQNSYLNVSGLIKGEKWSVCNILGVLLYESIATEENATIILPSKGIYIVRSGNNFVKVTD